MSRGLIGKKLGMTAFFSPDGRQVPVTVLNMGPNVVTQVKTKATDGYNAIQLGFGKRKNKRINKPMEGHFVKSGEGAYALLREFRVNDPDQYSPGQTLTIDMFEIGEHINVTGVSKGCGFAGVIKRHGFHGGRSSHGSMSHRIPGSVGCSATPGRVIKGKKMPGHFGNSRVTVRNLEIVDIRPEQNILILKGSVPGTVSGVIEIKKQDLPT
ncbi:50S ribosomal subunit protein L3 [Candidatus Magnetomoraceae bacterium gMMP-15]